MKSSFSWMGKESGFSRWKSTSGENAVKVFEMITKDWKYSVNLVYKPAAGFEMVDSNSERNSVGKMLLSSIACYREIIKVNQCGKLHRCLILRNCHSHSSLQQHHPDQSAAINIKARLSNSKNIITHLRFIWWLAFFSNKIFDIYFFRLNAIAHLIDSSTV